MEKMLYIVGAFCLAVLAVLTPSLVAALRGATAGNYFTQSLLPELIGLCLEGLLFVGLLEALQRRLELRRIKTLRATVLDEVGFLRMVITNCLLQSSIGPLRDDEIDLSSAKRAAETMAAFDAAEQQRQIDARLGRTPSLPDRFSGIAESVANAVRTKAKVHLRRLEPLTSVAAQLGDRFLADWLGMNDALYALTQEEGFSQGQIATFGEDSPSRYSYGRVVDLFRRIDSLGA